MYQPYAPEENQLLLPSEFILPFGGRLNPENRWIKLAQLVPWARVDHKYAKSFKKSFRGQKAISVRMALGALIIQERLQQSDRETVETIIENPYLHTFSAWLAIRIGRCFIIPSGPISANGLSE